MNSAAPTPGNSKQRFIQNLADSELFHRFQDAFRALTGLSLSLHCADETDESAHEPATWVRQGLVHARVPVKLGKRVLALMETSGVRLIPPGDEAFATVAKAMLDNDHSAAEIRAAKAEFDRQPAMEAARHEAALTVLRSFASQLGEGAHRLLFAHATHEPEAVRNAKAFIHSHLAENMSLETVARAVNVSPFHFCKLFKRATGLTFTDFVNHARVEKAKRLLMRPSSRITEVAFDVGFQSLSHFNRSFRRITSESPTEFRSRLKSAGSGMELMAA